MRLAPMLLLSACALASLVPIRDGVRARAPVHTASMVATGQGLVLGTALDRLLPSLAKLRAPADALAVPETPIRKMPSGLSEAEIALRLETDPESLGSLSIGRPSRGALVNGRRMPDGPHWRVVEPDRAFGTDEAIASIVAAVEHVQAAHPGTPELYIGNLSSKNGGYLRPHRSHQSGRDADIGYFYQGGPGWYARATATNLDRPRTWELVKAFATDPNVEYVFIDRSVQRLLRDYAEQNGDSRELLRAVFDGDPQTAPVIRHEWGHLTHLHVRFRSPEAQRAGVLAHRSVDVMRRLGKLGGVASRARRAVRAPARPRLALGERRDPVGSVSRARSRSRS